MRHTNRSQSECECLPGLAGDDLVQAFDDAEKLLRRDPTNPLPEALAREGTDLAHFDPGSLWKLALRQLDGQRKTRRRRLARDRHRDDRAGALVEDVVADDQHRAPSCLLSAPRRVEIGPKDVTPQYSGHDSRSTDALSSASSCS